jgi:uncharacterized protein YdaU (DUF1376 family)
VNFYPFHVGDYMAHTAHLDPLEDLAYRRLLDLYYLRELPIPSDIAETARLIRMKGNAAEVEAVLREFFTLADAGWTHERCDSEINKMQDKQAKARASAEASVKARSANAQRTLSERSTEVELPIPIPIPIPKEAETTAGVSDADTAPSADPVCAVVVACYHLALPNCQRTEVLTPKRRRRILFADKLARQLSREQGWEWDREWFWSAYFGECQADPWLRGDVPNPKNPRWRQNLDVLIAEDRFAGIMDAAVAANRETA